MTSDNLQLTSHPPRRTIAVGDIHGCALALRALLSAIAPTADDLLVFLGDYVDRGPDTRGVIETVLELSGQCRVVPLLGNHELMMLDALEQRDVRFWLDCGGISTVRSYGGRLENIPPAHLDFLRSCRRYFETDQHIFVHANYQADLPLAEQPEDLLFWTHISYYQPPPHQSGKRVIVGHTPQPTGEILDLGHVVAIDTYCVGTGWLTALDVHSGRQWQADKQGRLRQLHR